MCVWETGKKKKNEAIVISSSHIQVIIAVQISRHLGVQVTLRPPKRARAVPPKGSTQLTNTDLHGVRLGLAGNGHPAVGCETSGRRVTLEGLKGGMIGNIGLSLM